MKPHVMFKDWSLNAGRGGYKTGGGWGACKVLPLRKRGGGQKKVLAMLKGRGTTSFGVVFYAVA